MIKKLPVGVYLFIFFCYISSFFPHKEQWKQKEKWRLILKEIALSNQTVDKDSTDSSLLSQQGKEGMLEVQKYKVKQEILD